MIKTKFVLFGVRQLLSKFPSNITVPFLGQDLVPVAAARDLGVTLDSNLTFNGHISSLTSPFLSTSVQINRVPHLFSKDVLCIILNSLQLAILVVQNSHAGTQRSHWDRTNKGNYAFCWSCPSATFASQHGGFVPREWQAAKGLFILGPGRRVKSLYKAYHLLEVEPLVMLLWMLMGELLACICG